MSNISAKAEDIYKLMLAAIDKINDGDINTKPKASIISLVQELNKSAFQGKVAFDLKFDQLYKSYFLLSQRLTTKLGKGDVGLAFTATDYLNRLSMYVHGKYFTEQFGNFNGVLWDIKQGIERIPEITSAIDNTAFLKDLKALGITGTANKLSTSRFEPKQCIEETKHSLYFMGLLGSKWVEDKDKFIAFLKKVQSKPNGRVRYLMIDPTGDSFKLLKTMRGESLNDRSTQVFRDLVEEFACLEARFYEFLPCFRLIFIDNKILAASRYKLDESNYIKSKQGWEAPHLVIDAEPSDWSLYEPFLSYFETIWRHSRDIRDVVRRKTTSNAKGKNRRNTR